MSRHLRFVAGYCALSIALGAAAGEGARPAAGASQSVPFQQQLVDLTEAEARLKSPTDHAASVDGEIDAPCGRVNPHLRVACTSGCGQDQASAKNGWCDLAPGASDRAEIDCGPWSRAELEASCTRQSGSTAASLRVIISGRAARGGNCAHCAGSGGQVSPVWQTRLALPDAQRQYRITAKLTSDRFKQVPGVCSLSLGSARFVTTREGSQIYGVRVSGGQVDVLLSCSSLAQRGQQGGGGETGDPCRHVEDAHAVTLLMAVVQE